MKGNYIKIKTSSASNDLLTVEKVGQKVPIEIPKYFRVLSRLLLTLKNMLVRSHAEDSTYSIEHPDDYHSWFLRYSTPYRMRMVVTITRVQTL